MTFAFPDDKEYVECGVAGPNVFAPGDDSDRFTAMVAVTATRVPINTHPFAVARFKIVVFYESSSIGTVLMSDTNPG